MMNRDTYIGLAIAFLTLVFLFLQNSANDSESTAQLAEREQFVANYGSPTLDGDGSDEAWQQSEWLPLNQIWLGAQPAAADYAGRYKLAWDENNLYILAEITDDTLMDTHADGLDKYWDDDCLEIFLDEDASGGEHQYNYNAFAYHIALDGKVVDINPKKEFAYYNEHCTTRRKTVGHVTTWEVAVSVFDGKTYTDGGENIPKMLGEGKKMGFALAYCDNDRSPERENFVGSVRVEGDDKNRGWIDASIFGLLELK